MKNKSGAVPWLIALVTIAIILAVTLFSFQPPDADIQKSLAETRQTLRDQGFKTDVSDFDFSASGDPAARAGDLVRNSYALPRQMLASEVNLVPPASADSVAVIWQQEFVHVRSENIDWAGLHEILDPAGTALDVDVDTLLSGPYSFDLDAHKGFALLLPHLPALRNTSMTLANRTILELHDGQNGSAWTNLLALSHLVTGWNTEPIESSQLIRYNLANTAFSATWQVLQKKVWTDEQLAGLQQEWAGVDFLRGLPDTVAFRRATVAQLCEQGRNGFSSPAARPSFSSLPGILQSWQAIRYRSYGTYADEKNLLLFYRDREVETRNAIKATNWLQMQAMPGITNTPTFTSPYPSGLASPLSSGGMGMGPRFARLGGGPFGRVVATETRRRLTITAIALERYRLRHQAYPMDLAALSPEFPDAPTIDFMDGKPLRYHLTNDDQFVLYSVGLDGVDNGGTLGTVALNAGTFPRGGGGRVGFYGAENTDIVWPRPATAAETAALNQLEAGGFRQQADDTETASAAGQWAESDRRQAAVDKILSGRHDLIDEAPNTSLRVYADGLRNPRSTGTNQLTLVQMLTPHQVITGYEPESITFQIPIAYDQVTNEGTFALLVDAGSEPGSKTNSKAEKTTIERAANGDCLLHWSTIFESPGRHALQLALVLNDNNPIQPHQFTGPAYAYSISNLCQFSLASATFDPAVGSILHARLPETNATYQIDYSLTDGTPEKTITGQTTNGEIKVFWNLRNDQGQRITDREFTTVLHLTLTDSGRTQTMHGP